MRYLAKQCNEAGRREAHVGQPVLELQLADDSPAIVREAADALGELIGWEACVDSLLKAASEAANDASASLLSDVLRFVSKKAGSKDAIVNLLQERINDGVGNPRLQVTMGGPRTEDWLMTTYFL